MATTRLALEMIARNRAKAEMAGFRRGVGTMTHSIKTLGRSALAIAGVGGGLYMLSASLRSGVREAMEYEKGLANISTLLADDMMPMMGAFQVDLREMSKRYGQSTDTLSKGLYDIISASVPADKALRLLEISTKAAVAGVTETAITADAFTTILNSYGKSVEEASHVSDVFFQIIKRGKTTAAELAPNIGKVASLAATAQVSFEDLGATIATLTRAGIQTETAITGVRSILTQFLKPANEAVDIAKKYGIELNTVTLRAMGLTGVFRRLKDATAEELALLMPNVRGMSAFAAALRQAEEAGQDYRAMMDAVGSSEKAYQKIAHTTYFQLQQSNQAWEDLKRLLGEDVAPVLLEITQLLVSMGNEIGKVKAPLRELLKDVGAMRPVVPPISFEDIQARIRAERSTEVRMRARQERMFEGQGRQTGRQLPGLVSRRTADGGTMSDERLAMLTEAGNTKIIALAKQRQVQQQRMAAESQQMANFTARAWQDAFRSMEWSASSVFVRMRQEGKSFGEAMEDVAVSIGDAFLDMLGQILVRQAMVAAIGGQSNYNNLMGTSVEGTKQGGGHVPRAGLYMLHGGEEVVQSHESGAPNIVINNESGVPIRQGAMQFQDGEWVVSLVAENYHQGGVMRDIVQGKGG